MTVYLGYVTRFVFHLLLSKVIDSCICIQLYHRQRDIWVADRHSTEFFERICMFVHVACGLYYVLGKAGNQWLKREDREGNLFIALVTPPYWHPCASWTGDRGIPNASVWALRRLWAGPGPTQPGMKCKWVTEFRMWQGAIFLTAAQPRPESYSSWFQTGH